MPTSSHSPIATDLEDFRRLGVRPNESRIAIIRAAVARSSKPLARQHLRTADTQTELQLSRVATSAYRVLDPRQREDQADRTRIGRILPLTLHLAGHTRFGDATPPPSMETAFHRQALSQLQWNEWLGLEDAEEFADDDQLWDDTQVCDGVPAQLVHSNRRHVAVAATLVVAASLMVWVAGHLLWSSFKRNQPSPSESEVVVAQSEWEQTHFLALPLSSAVAMPLVQDELVDPKPLLALTPSDLVPIESQRWIVRQAATPIEPVEETVYRRPADGSVSAARESLQAAYPELTRLALPNQLGNQIQVLQSASEEFEAGSVEDWTCQLMMAELAWLIDKPSTVRLRLEMLAGRYGESVDLLTAESFEAACRLASLPETHHRLLDHGMRMADQFLVAESFVASRRLVDALMPSANSLEQQTTISQLQTLRRAIDQAERFSAVKERVPMGPDQGATSEIQTSSLRPEIGVLGRYYCFYLRRWDVGLDYLAEAADPRLASAARRQLNLDVAADATQTMEVATLWLSLANRSQGRIADSLRLHGMELMESLLPQSNGLKKLRLQRRIQKESARLPAYLRRPVVMG